MKVSELHYSKLEIFALKFLFRDLLEEIKNNPKTRPEDLIAQDPKYRRDMLRSSFGIQRILFTIKERSCLVVIGLEDRRHNYIMEVEYCKDSGGCCE